MAPISVLSLTIGPPLAPGHKDTSVAPDAAAEQMFPPGESKGPMVVVVKRCNTGEAPTGKNEKHVGLSGFPAGYPT